MKKKYLAVLIPIVFSACEKANLTTYDYICTSTYQIDPFHHKTKVDTFRNITADAANAIIRARADSGWTTVCERQ